MKQKPYIKLANRLFQKSKSGRDFPRWFWDLRNQSEKMLFWGNPEDWGKEDTE